MVQFEEQKIASVLQDADMSEEDKLKSMSETFKKVSEMTISTIAKSVEYIKTPETMVSDSNQINEFLHECDRGIFETIKDNVLTMRSSTELKPLEIKCGECEHEYQQPFTLDMSNFFG